MEEQLLKDYVATYLNPKYNGDWDLVNSKFPELSGLDKQLLKDYVATYTNPKYNGDWDVVNSKFPELFPAGKSGAESPMAIQTAQEQPVKKKDTASPFVDGGSELTRFDPASGQVVQETPAFTQPKPEVKIPEQKLPARTEFQFQPGKPLPEQKTAPLPKFVEEQLSAVKPELIGKTEENVVPQLKYQFGPLGFKFEQTRAGDYMMATSPSGESIYISLDVVDNKDRETEANKLNAFLRKGATTVKNLSTLQKQYTDANKKIVSQKELDESLASINAEETKIMARNAEFVKAQNKLEAEKAQLESVPVQQRNNPAYIARVNDFIERADQFSGEFQTFAKDAEDLSKRGQQLNKSIGKYTEMKAEQGTWYGAALNAFANKSYYEMAKGLSGVAVDFIGEVISATGLPIMSPENYEKTFIEQAKKEGINVTEGEDFISLANKLDPETLAKIENRVIDAGKKSVKGEVVGGLDKASKMIMESSGVSPEYYRSIEETFVGGALLGALTSIPAMAGGPVTRTILMGSQVLSGLDTEMANNPEFADISENEKLLVKAPIAVAVGVLESLGLSNLLKQKGFLNGIVLKALGKVGTGASYKTFGEVIKNEVESAVDRGALTLGAGFLAEAETGALQEVADIGIKEIYNMAKEKEMFDTPDSVVKFIEQVGKAGLQEGIGAGVLSVPGSVSAAYTGKGFLGMDDAQFAMFEKMANDSNIQKGFVARLKSRINNGEIAAAEGKDILNNYRNSVGLFNSLPENLDMQGKKEAMNLLKEKRDLERQIDGKDQALTTPQRNRVNEINQQLTKLSEDAIQEQAAGQVPVQPGATVSQEVAQGEPQAEPQGVAEEGQVQEVAPVSPAVSPAISPIQEATPQVDFTEAEVNALSDLLDKSESEGKNLPEVFQLETTTDNEGKKQVLVESATKLMETVSDDLSSTSKPTNAPTMETTPIVITENTELTNKVSRFPLVDLIKKKINLVMADQLKVGDGFMGGPLFPLIDGIFGKAAWASINLDAARKIVRGAINGDYSVVFNMNPTAVDSNTAFMDTFIKKLNEAGIKENVLVELKSYVKDKKFGKKTDQIRKIAETSNTIDEFSEKLSELDVDTISDFVKKIIPSKSVVAETAIGKILQAQNITQEDIRGEISEQLAKDLPMGAMTMVLKITDANGNPVTEKNIDDAIITPEQQKAEGIPSHRNYPFYVRGTALGILDSTVPFWNMSKAAMSTINAKVAKVIRNNEGKAYSASQARAAAMRSASMKASKAFTTQAPTKSTYQQFIERLSKAIPSVEVVTSQKQFDDLLTNLNAKSLATKNQKIYGAVLDGKLYLNPSLENFNTPIHEFAHVWTNTIKELSPEIYQKGIELIKGSDYVSQIEASKDYKRITDKMKKDGATDQEISDYILEEALATAIGDKGESFATAAQQRNFKNWLNDLFAFIKKLTGISKLTPEQIQNISLDDFLNSVVVDLLSENKLFKNAEVNNLSNQLQLMAKPDLKADDIVKIGLANGFSVPAIKELLSRRGFTEQAINEALGKQTPAAKKVEVTEEFAPGYDRMIGQLEGVVEKSLKRGTTQAKAMENAINYLQGTKVYENATDVQRETMVRDVNKRFKKREKRAPSAKKVLGQKKDVVTITVDLAKERDRIIKEQIKQAKEVTGDLNEKRAALANSIRLFEDGGVITTAQTKTIVNRISKVNLNNPIMVDRLLAYIEKVFDNANYAADMTELRKLQRQARTKKHTSMKDFVDRFTFINPELIPLDRLQDYKEALDFLNNRTPSYARMNEMLPEIESYELSEKFDSVKTIDDIKEKYKGIRLNKVESVEEYVALIKDINSIKRKLYQLLENEVISQQEYDIQVTIIGEDQLKVENNYAVQITKIKKDLIAEINKQRPKTNPEFTKEENDLIKEYLELNDADLESLSPEDLFVLNDLLENVSNGEIDYYRFKNVVSKAANNKAGVEVGKQLKTSKLSLGSAELRKKMAQFESSFWEGLLGLGRATSGPLQKFIISPFNRAIGSYEKFLRDGYNDFLKLKKKYKIDDSKLFKSTKQMQKIGMLTTYLQEYMAQFDPKNKGIKDIGKRDWFKEILATETMRDDYSPEELKIIEEIHESLPKDKDGNVDPKAVYDSYIANDGKFFTKNEKGFFDAVMEWKKNNSTSKQKAANEMSGNAFKEIPFHMLRSRYSGQTSQITPSTSGDNGMIRIKAGTGKERASEAVGAINTNFEKLFIKGLEQTGRDYFLSKTLKDINNVLASAKKELNGDKDPLVKAISYTLSDALAYEFSDTASQNILKRLVQARAAMTLFDPIRAGVEFTSTLLSFGLRARTLSGYKNLFGSQGEMRNLLEFTDSPLRLRQNINNAIDINDGRIEPQGMLMKWTSFLSGLPERTMMVTSWMPTFTSEFQNITKEKFDMKKFNDSEAYREKYGKAIKEASAVADAQTEKIVGPTTKAGQRRDIVIFPGKTVGRDTVSGQILGFFSNYPYREVTEFVNGFKEAGEVLKKADTVEAISQLQKPLGIALNVAAYGFLSSVVYASRLILLGDDDEEERGNKLLEELMTAKGFIEETAANAAALAASKYAGGGRAILQVLGTLGIMMTDNEETKATIKKMLKGSVYVDPLPTQKLTGYGTADKVNTAILKYIPQFVVLSNVIIDGLGGLNEIKAIYDKVESKGVNALTEDEELRVLALSVMFTATQLYLNYKGSSLPSYNTLKAGMKTVKEEAGVADISAGKVPAKKKSSSGGGGSRAKTMNKTDLKKYNRELYDQMYGKGSATYEIEQEIKAFEKEQREFKKDIKDRVFGGD